jgi:hypothetical protein
MIHEEIARYGCAVVSSGTLRPQDLVQAYLGALRELAPDVYIRLVMPGTDSAACLRYVREEDDNWWRSDACAWLLEQLTEALCEHSPPGTFFGAHEGDGALFGFWGDDEGGSEDNGPATGREDFHSDG